MKILALIPDRNTLGINPKTGRPWKDGDEFRNEAEAAADVWRTKGHAVITERFDYSKPLPSRFAQTVGYLRHAPDMIAHFGHGWHAGLQCGLTLGTVPSFVSSVKARCPGLRTFVMYSCSAGGSNVQGAPGGDGGIADKVRDALSDAGIPAVLWAHENAGHTTLNPRLRVFSPPAAKGGQWVIAPDDPKFGAWRHALASGLRFAFPFETLDEIRGQV